MQIELMAITENPEISIANYGKVCYKSEKVDDVESARRFIKKRIEQGHESILEHGYATFHLSGVSRALSHQLVRHRHASFSQSSQRYVKESQFDFVTPKSIDMDDAIDGAKWFFPTFMKKCQQAYDFLISRGIKPEDARFVLPNACCTEIIISANFREWRHIIKMRSAPDAQWEIQKMSKIILEKFLKLSPSIFEDLTGEVYD